eukprot:7231722-Prymnesium_polylepis.1
MQRDMAREGVEFRDGVGGGLGGGGLGGGGHVDGADGVAGRRLREVPGTRTNAPPSSSITAKAQVEPARRPP